MPLYDAQPIGDKCIKFVIRVMDVTKLNMAVNPESRQVESEFSSLLRVLSAIVANLLHAAQAWAQ